MKRMMLVGRTGCGKTTLIQSMQGRELVYRKTQAVRYTGLVVDTPGEFLENRHYYSALMATSTSCDVIALVQDGAAVHSVFPPKFTSMFNKEAIGIVSKTDLAACDIERAEKFLGWAGVKTIFHTSSIRQTGIDVILAWLDSDNAARIRPSAGETLGPRSITSTQGA